MKNIVNRALVAEKKVIILFAAVLMAAGAYADRGIIIQREFFGCKLGQSTRAEVLKSMKIIGAKEVVVDTASVSFSYEGWHEGMNYSGVIVKFMNDTLFGVTYVKKCNEPCEGNLRALCLNLKRKYPNLPTLENTEKGREVMALFQNDSNYVWFGCDFLTMIRVQTLPEELEGFSCSYYNMAIGEAGKALLNYYDESNKVTSVAGVKFGTSRSATIEAFKSRGIYDRTEGNSVIFHEVRFGGSIYSTATLLFINDRFAAVRFEKNFGIWKQEEALMMYEAIINSFDCKYSNKITTTDEDVKKYSFYGMPEKNYMNGEVPPIAVVLDLGVSRGGNKFYYVTVSYFGGKMTSLDLEDL